MRIDVHQHIWTAPLAEALSRRTELPLIRGDHQLSTVHCAGEQPWVLHGAGEAVGPRTALLDADGLDAAIVAISSPIGIEALEREQARTLIDAHLDGVAALGPRFGAWGPLLTDRPGPADVDHLADRGCLGISLPAGALAEPGRLAALAPALTRISERGLSLFIHPGRAHGDRVGHPGLDEPLWWPALTRYVTEMQAAWLSWVTAGRAEHPELLVVFSMLGGLAPLQAERLDSRGGPPVDLADPLTFYDTSSYGLDAISAMAGVVSHNQLLYGSDRPVLEPTRTSLDGRCRLNAGAVFGPAFGAHGLTAPGPSTPSTRVWA